MQAVGVGGACCVEESWNVTRVCQTVLFYIGLSPPPRGCCNVSFWHRWLVCVFFFFELTHFMSVFSSHQRRARDALHVQRSIPIQTNTHRMLCHTPASCCVAAGKWQSLLFPSLQQRSDCDCMDRSTVVHYCHFHLSPITQIW